MLAEALTALAAAGGTAVVQAAGQDAWTGFRARVAKWFARGDTGRSMSRWSEQVERIAPPELVGRETELRELAAYCTEPAETRIRQIDEALFSDSPTAYMLLAWDDDTLIGFASYSFLWPAIGLSRSLYLKELYVSTKARRAGVGKLLMQHLFDIAVQNDCSRVEGTTDADNREAHSAVMIWSKPSVFNSHGTLLAAA